MRIFTIDPPRVQKDIDIAAIRDIWMPAAAGKMSELRIVDPTTGAAIRAAWRAYYRQQEARHAQDGAR